LYHKSIVTYQEFSVSVNEREKKKKKTQNHRAVTNDRSDQKFQNNQKKDNQIRPNTVAVKKMPTKLRKTT
jgi:hypothetical protein